MGKPLFPDPKDKVGSRFIRYFVELLGTFVFLFVILATAGTDLAYLGIGLALAIVVLFAGFISGGMMNPAVSLMFAVDKQIDWCDFLGYVVAQFGAGLLVYLFARKGLPSGGYHQLLNGS